MLYYDGNNKSVNKKMPPTQTDNVHATGMTSGVMNDGTDTTMIVIRIRDAARGVTIDAVMSDGMHTRTIDTTRSGALIAATTPPGRRGGRTGGDTGIGTTGIGTMPVTSAGRGIREGTRGIREGTTGETPVGRSPAKPGTARQA